MANQDFRVKNGLQVGVGGTIITADVGGNVGINSTSPSSTLDVQGTISASSTITAPTFAGTATTATNLSNAANITAGTISADRLTGSYGIDISGNAGTATTANNLSDAANITTGTISPDRLTGSYGIDITGTATTATNLSDAANITTGTISPDRLSGTYDISITGSVTSENIGVSTATVTYDLNVGAGDTGVFIKSNGDVFSSGIITATTFVGNLTGTATTATKLENSRDFSVSGDVATASPVSFDGTGNVDLAVTLSNDFSANTSGIITATTFVGNLTGTATTATNLSDAANITTGTISDDRLPATISSNITGNAGTATTASNLTRSVIAGSGLTGGGELTSNVTLNIGAGTGITINADDIALKNSGSLTNNTVIKWDGTQLDNTIITDTGTNIGIGSTIPSTKLDIAGNLNIAGVGNTATISGPDNIVLDPATVGDNTGTVTILGNLQVEGTQTIINSTTLEVDDKLVSIAKSATNATQADGAGLEINGASATLTYAFTDDKWVFNKAPYYNANRLLTTADEGSGNGIDADQLDGQDGTYYLNYSNFVGVATDSDKLDGQDGTYYLNYSNFVGIATNADKLDGEQGSYYLDYANFVGVATDADKLDGEQGSYYLDYANFVGVATDADKLDGEQGSYYTNADNISSGTLSNARLPQNISVTGIITASSFKSSSTTVIANDTLNIIATSGTFTATAGIATDIDTFTISTNDFKTTEYTLHFTNGSNIQAQKVLVMQNGTSAYSQEYAIMYEPNQIVSIGATVSGGTLKLQATPETGISGITTYRFTRGGLL